MTSKSVCIGLHRVKEQRAVVPLHRCKHGRQRREGASRQGGTSPQVERHDSLVQAQLAGDAVERLGVQIQDGDQGGESRRSGRWEVSESPWAAEGGGQKEGRVGKKISRYIYTHTYIVGNSLGESI